jgi:ribonucleoside-diphosphate reductase alpha chain
VKDEEWNEVFKYIFDNREYFTAVSLLPASGDKLYKQAPLEAITTPEDEELWNKLVSNYKPVDYTELKETEDNTHLVEAIACAGGNCEVR